MKIRRESRYVQIARLAYRLAQQVLPLYSHPNSPKTYTQPQLAAGVLLMFYLDLSYRDMEELLLAAGEIREELNLTSIPDHSTLNRMYQRLKVGQLQAMNRRLLAELEPQGEVIALDATSYSRSQASLHFATVTGLRHHFSHYWKGYYLVDIETQLIWGWRAIRAPSSDMAYLQGLRHQMTTSKRHFRLPQAFILLADRGFDGKAVRPGDLIPPRRPVQRQDRLDRQELVDAARLDGLWGQRWKSETVHSVIKRKTGSTIRSHLYWYQYREPLIKGLVYNLHR